jgi:hypothetical protein
MAEITENTVCGSASICSSPSAVTRASRLISMMSSRFSAALTATMLDRPDIPQQIVNRSSWLWMAWRTGCLHTPGLCYCSPVGDSAPGQSMEGLGDVAGTDRSGDWVDGVRPRRGG